MLLELERVWGDADLASRLSLAADDGRLPGLLLALAVMAAARWVAWPLARGAASLSWRLAGAAGRAVAWPFRAAPTEPLMAEVVLALLDSQARCQPDGKGAATLSAGGMEFLLSIDGVFGEAHVVEAEANGRNVWPDLTEAEKVRAQRLLSATLRRVAERDRLASRAESLAAIRGGPPAGRVGYFLGQLPPANTATADNRVPVLRGGLAKPLTADESRRLAEDVKKAKEKRG